MHVDHSNSLYVSGLVDCTFFSQSESMYYFHFQTLLTSPNSFTKFLAILAYHMTSFTFTHIKWFKLCQPCILLDKTFSFRIFPFMVDKAVLTSGITVGTLWFSLECALYSVGICQICQSILMITWLLYVTLRQSPEVGHKTDDKKVHPPWSIN